VYTIRFGGIIDTRSPSATCQASAMTDTLNAAIAQGWAEHVDDSAGVALRLPGLLDQVQDEAGLMALARLAHHVHGEHLAQWDDGLKFLAALARLPAFEVNGASGQALRRLRGSLALAANQGDLRNTLDDDDRIAVTAMAANALGPHDTARALVLLQEALADAERTPLADSAAAVRALAVAGNNLAATLQEQARRSEAEVALMLLAGRTSRQFWARAGTWLETERADYTLSLCWLAAGDAAQARQHAQACLDRVHAQPEPPALERFYGFEALCRAERAAGDSAAQARACDQAQAAFADLQTDEQPAHRAALDALLQAATPAG
jgi:hypothetical protein